MSKKKKKDTSKENATQNLEETESLKLADEVAKGETRTEED